MRRKQRAFYGGLCTALLFLLLGVGSFAFLTLRAHAIDDLGPDKNEFGGANVYYELSNTSNVVSTTAIIPFYYPTRPTSPPTVSITCGDGNGTILTDWRDPTDGSYTNYDGNLCNSSTITIPLSAFPATEDSETGYFRAILRFRIKDSGTYKAFKLNIDNTARIGYSAGNGTHFAIANLNRCDPGGDTSGCPNSGQTGYWDYKLPFAPKCSQASGYQNATILDPDNPSGSAPYGIQPQKFNVKIVEYNKNGDVTDSSVHYDFTSGTDTDNKTLWNYKFYVKQGHNYQFWVTHVYSNNVIQFGLPFDSINYDVACLSKTLTKSCTSLSGAAWDTYDHTYGDVNSPIIRLYAYINPAAGDPQTTYSNTTAMTNDLGSPWTYLDANDHTPAADSNGNGVADVYDHGYTINLPPPSYRSNGYKGPWEANTYTIYMREVGTSTVKKLGTYTIGPCAIETCPSAGTYNLIAGQSYPFVASIKSNNYGGEPLPAPYFTLSVTDPKGNTTTTTRGPNWNDTTNTITSNPYTLPIQYTGTYAFKWTYDGVNCGPDNARSGYVPYVSVLGGDVAAGAGFGNGGCTENNADIKSWNNDNTVLPNYFGAGSEIGAWATGDITDFASGLGIAGGTSAYSGHALSFANSGAGVASSPPGYGGQFGSAIPCIPDFYGTSTSSSPAAAPQTLNNGNFFNASGNYQSTPGGASNDIEITAGAADPATTITVPAGQTITLYVKGNVYIGSNIMYGSYSLSDVPRFNLYVQGNIFIGPNVRELHGVYTAQKDPSHASTTGNITTCADSVYAATEPYATCAKYPLKVVGAMASEGKLVLSRTRGNLSTVVDAAVPGGTVPNTPAETFQFSPELWLNTSSAGTAELKAYTSLPPIL